MSIVKMKKLAAIGLDNGKEDLIKKLMDLGVCEITNETIKLTENEDWQGLGTKDGDEDLSSMLDANLSRVENALETLRTYSPRKEPLFFTRRLMTSLDFSKILKNREKIISKMEEILSLKDQLNENHEKINKANSYLSSLRMWAEYDADISTASTNYTDITFGVFPTTLTVPEIMDMIDFTDKWDIRKVSSDKDLIYTVVTTHKDETERVHGVLKQRGFAPIDFDELTGTATENIEKFNAQIIALEEENAKIKEKIGTYEENREDIECLHDQLIMERDAVKVKENIIKTGRTFYFMAWYPDVAERSVEKVLKAAGCTYEFAEPTEDEKPPVMLDNNGLVTPFESITEMYDLPDYHGFDPTKIFAFFYAMFFGIMLSDAGYGIIISIATFIILKKFDLEGLMGKMIKSFFWCGLSTVFWGAMFGGWFGDIATVVSKTFFNSDFTIQPLWFNPMQDPVKLLIWSLIFGVVHLFVAMGINAYMLIKRGHFFDAVCDVFSWYLVILGIAAYGCGDMVGMGWIVPIGMYMAIAGVA
ncbi:MAG: V-type ATP synthase subunit I, partial [Clostridia bacterium]|nr:V-type ATP synthase subunit I [Clostridia bacterium]